jgi:hypothetical protein
MRRELGHLILARTVYRSVLVIAEAFDRGDETEARRGLSILARELGPIVPQVEQVIADPQTAEAFDRTQSTLARFFPGRAEPHLNAANDEQTTTPTHPAPSLA